MLLSEVKATADERPWYLDADKEVLDLRNMFNRALGYKIDFSPITHWYDVLYMYNNKQFKLEPNVEHAAIINRINSVLSELHKKNTRNVLCTITENCTEDANGNGVFENFQVSVRYITYNDIQDKMWGFFGHVYFTPDVAKDFVPELYEYCTNNLIIYAIDDLTKEEQNDEYVQFLIHKAIKDYDELKQLAEVLSL